jgi:hypothetical protein
MMRRREGGTEHEEKESPKGGDKEVETATQARPQSQEDRPEGFGEKERPQAEEGSQKEREKTRAKGSP